MSNVVGSRDLTNLRVPVNVYHSGCARDYTFRVKMTRSEFLHFVSDMQAIFDHSTARVLHYVEEVRDGFRGDRLSFVVYHPDVRCQFGWNDKGAYLSPAKGYPLFGRADLTNDQVVVIGDWLKTLLCAFDPLLPSPPPIHDVVQALVF